MHRRSRRRANRGRPPPAGRPGQPADPRRALPGTATTPANGARWRPARRRPRSWPGRRGGAMARSRPPAVGARRIRPKMAEAVDAGQTARHRRGRPGAGHRRGWPAGSLEGDLRSILDHQQPHQRRRPPQQRSEAPQPAARHLEPGRGFGHAEVTGERRREYHHDPASCHCRPSAGSARRGDRADQTAAAALPAQGHGQTSSRPPKPNAGTRPSWSGSCSPRRPPAATRQPCAPAATARSVPRREDLRRLGREHQLHPTPHPATRYGPWNGCTGERTSASAARPAPARATSARPSARPRSTRD